MKKSKQQCDLTSCYMCRTCMADWKPAISANKVTRLYKKGDLIFKEGDPVKGIYFINSGIVKVHKQWEENKELIIRFAVKGDILGHRGIGKEPAYPIGATVLQEAKVCFVDLHFFMSTLKVNPEFSFQLLMFLAAELQESEKRMSHLAHMPVKGRIALSLLSLKDKFGTDEEGFISYPISRQDLSAFSGTIYETVYKFLNELIEEKVIETQDKRIRILEESKLALK